MTHSFNGPGFNQNIDPQTGGQLLVDYMAQLTPITEEEKQVILEAIPIRTYPKGTILLREGQIANECYMNFKGCVREYYLNDGIERTSEFYLEGDSIAASLSNAGRIPSKHYLECVEDTTLSVLTYEKEMELYKRFPKFESICRIEVEKKLGLYQEKMANFIHSSPEERYKNLLKTKPSLVHRVPHYQLASYLGVKPESLSRIRKRLLIKS